jgi:class 3 adenylate cyclase
MFHFRGVREGLRPDGQPYIDASRSAMLAIGFLEPKDTTGFAFLAEPGLMAGISSDTEAGFLLRIGEEVAKGPQSVDLTFDGAGYSADEVRLAAGPVRLSILNPTGERSVLAILRMPPDHDDAFLRFEPYLTGKHLLTSQTFRGLFRSEVIGGAEGIAIRDIAILFTDIKGSTALYRQIGDLNAFQLVQQHFDWLREATVRHGGAVVKTIGDAVMASYPDAEAAVAAALDMQLAAERFNRSQPDRPVALKIGIHHGAAIAVTLNEELDYFGQTVNIAARVQAMADAQEICLTDEVRSYPGVAGLLNGCETREVTAELRGVGRPMPVTRVGRAVAGS